MDQNSQGTMRSVDRVEGRGSSLLVGKGEAARLTGISARSVDRLVSAGKFLRPVRLGGRVLWDRVALEGWVRVGCPTVKPPARLGGVV